MIIKISTKEKLEEFLDQIVGKILRFFLLPPWRIAYDEKGLKEYLFKVLSIKDSSILLNCNMGGIFGIAVAYPIEHFSEIHKMELPYDNAILLEPLVVDYVIGVDVLVEDLIKGVATNSVGYTKIIILEDERAFIYPLFRLNGFIEAEKVVLRVVQRTEIGLRKVDSWRRILTKEIE